MGNGAILDMYQKDPNNREYTLANSESMKMFKPLSISSFSTNLECSLSLTSSKSSTFFDYATKSSTTINNQWANHQEVNLRYPANDASGNLKMEVGGSTNSDRQLAFQEVTKEEKSFAFVTAQCVFAQARILPVRAVLSDDFLAALANLPDLGGGATTRAQFEATWTAAPQASKDKYAQFLILFG